MKIDTSIQFMYVDLFCGAGGTSTGVEDALVKGKKCAKVIACVNHDANAIASHAANHPDALHFTEDIRTLNLDSLIAHILKMRVIYPNAKLVLWASLECTNFSKAKGGQSRDADSRTLAEHLFRYIEGLNPDYVQIENVEEFMTWGPLIIKTAYTEEGYEYCPCNRAKNPDTKRYCLTPIMIPDPQYIGVYYNKWIKNVKKHGYKFDYRILNSADYGAYTSRKRYFGIFARPELPIAFPKQTHSKAGSKGLFEELKKWKPVKDCLDFTDEGESIFGRKKPLVEPTLDRVLSGLIKFVAGGKDKWLLKYNSVNGNTRRHNPPSVDDPCPTVSCQGRLGVVQTTSMAEYLIQYNKGKDRVKSIDDPCNTVTTYNRFGLVQTSFLSKHFSGHPESKNISVEAPAHTITAIDHHSLVNMQFIAKYYSGNPDQMIAGINEPAATLRTKDSQALVSPSFLSAYYGNGHNHSIESPSPTVTTKDRLALVVPQYFIDLQYGNGTPSAIDAPATTLTTNPKHQLVQCDKWLMNTNFNNVGSSIEEPSPVITANRKWHYLMNPQFQSKGGDIDAPCFTLIARMDKMPPYLIEATNESHHIPSFIKIQGNTVIYEIYEDDSPKMKEIKEFMALYGILDVKMRMLRIPELKMIMGFPKNYILIGTQADQKKFIGNAVETKTARAICEANAIEILKYEMAV
jgi:DNA (cytosine-5)-methyltransferase 1